MKFGEVAPNQEKIPKASVTFDGKTLKLYSLTDINYIEEDGKETYLIMAGALEVAGKKEVQLESEIKELQEKLKKLMDQKEKISSFCDAIHKMDAEEEKQLVD